MLFSCLCFGVKRLQGWQVAPFALSRPAKLIDVVHQLVRVGQGEGTAELKLCFILLSAARTLPLVPYLICIIAVRKDGSLLATWCILCGVAVSAMVVIFFIVIAGRSGNTLGLGTPPILFFCLARNRVHALHHLALKVD